MRHSISRYLILLDRRLFLCYRQPIRFSKGFDMQSTPAKGASPAAIWAGMLVIYIVWGSTYLGMRFAIETMPPFLMASFRFLTAGAILFVWRRLSGDPAPTRANWRSAAIIGLFLLLGGNGGVVWAEQRIPSGIAALLVGSTPLWMIIVDEIIRRVAPGSRPDHARPGWLGFLGILIGFGGIILLVSPSELSGLGEHVDLIGALAVTLAAFLWACGSLYSRTADLPASPIMAPAMEMLVGGAALGLMGTFTGEWARLDVVNISLRSWLGLGYLIVFGALAGYATYTWLLRNAPTTLVSTYAYVNPIVAIFIGNLLAQEPLTPRVIIAAAVILGSVGLITVKRPKKAF
jgi:drug/metabolite transporter (DMT)-like permease